MTERQTPEVDALAYAPFPTDYPDELVVPAGDARRLERERDKARERLVAAEAEMEVIRGALDTKCYELGEALKRIAELEKGVNEALAAIRAYLEGNLT